MCIIDINAMTAACRCFTPEDCGRKGSHAMGLFNAKRKSVHLGLCCRHTHKWAVHKLESACGLLLLLQSKVVDMAEVMEVASAFCAAQAA